MIRALLWGRYCAIVAEFQYNGLAEDLTHWGGRVQASAPHRHPLNGCTRAHTHTHSDLIALPVYVQLFISLHVHCTQ